MVVNELSEIIRDWARSMTVEGKMGRDVMQPSLARHLEKNGFTVKQEDYDQFLKSRMPVWRSKDDLSIVPTQLRRKIDIIVYKNVSPIALIETESDLKDLRQEGVTNRNGHYDVFSIARTGTGKFFNSYKSLERMASAAFYFHMSQELEHYPSEDEGVEILQEISSDSWKDHNPAGMQLYLVSGFCRPKDHGILKDRLEATGGELICISTS